jgi:hypothetical protein
MVSGFLVCGLCGLFGLGRLCGITESNDIKCICGMAARLWNEPRSFSALSFAQRYGVGEPSSVCTV